MNMNVISNVGHFENVNSVSSCEKFREAIQFRLVSVQIELPLRHVASNRDVHRLIDDDRTSSAGSSRRSSSRIKNFVWVAPPLFAQSGSD